MLELSSREQAKNPIKMSAKIYATLYNFFNRRCYDNPNPPHHRICPVPSPAVLSNISHHTFTATYQVHQLNNLNRLVATCFFYIPRRMGKHEAYAHHLFSRIFIHVVCQLTPPPLSSRRGGWVRKSIGQISLAAIYHAGQVSLPQSPDQL